MNLIKGDDIIDKIRLCITHGHKTLGAKWLFEQRFSHQSSVYLDSEVAPNSPNDFIPHPLPTIQNKTLLKNCMKLFY